MEKQKYLKTWMGVTSGSYMGRDDGYPELKMAILNEDGIAHNFGTKNQERYFKLEELKGEEFEKMISAKQDVLEAEKKQKEKAKLLEELENLKKKISEMD